MTDVVLRVRFIYKGFDVPLRALGVSPAADESRIKKALADYLLVPLNWLNSYIFERHSDGNLALRFDE